MQPRGRAEHALAWSGMARAAWCMHQAGTDAITGAGRDWKDVGDRWVTTQSCVPCNAEFSDQAAKRNPALQPPFQHGSHGSHVRLEERRGERGAGGRENRRYGNPLTCVWSAGSSHRSWLQHERKPFSQLAFVKLHWNNNANRVVAQCLSVGALAAHTGPNPPIDH